MAHLKLEISEIPHGHGLSFKKGVADGLLKNNDNIDSCSETHLASYWRGHKAGSQLKEQIASLVKA